MCAHTCVISKLTQKHPDVGTNNDSNSIASYQKLSHNTCRVPGQQSTWLALAQGSLVEASNTHTCTGSHLLRVLAARNNGYTPLINNQLQLTCQYTGVALRGSSRKRGCSGAGALVPLFCHGWSGDQLWGGTNYFMTVNCQSNSGSPTGVGSFLNVCMYSLWLDWTCCSDQTLFWRTVFHVRTTLKQEY